MFNAWCNLVLLLNVKTNYKHLEILDTFINLLTWFNLLLKIFSIIPIIKNGNICPHLSFVLHAH